MSDDLRPKMGIVKFLDESDSFAHGFECGKLWLMLSEKKEIVKFPVYVANCAMIERLCIVHHKHAVFTKITDSPEFPQDRCYLTVEPLLKIIK